MYEEDRDQLETRLIKEEGRRSHLYKDSKGIWTIGVGYNIEEKGLPEDVIDDLLDRSIDEAYDGAKSLVAWHCLDSVRRTVLVAMVFQMGLLSVRKFKKALKAMCVGDYKEAHDQMLDSKWAIEDSPARALREAQIMLTGEYNDD